MFFLFLLFVGEGNPSFKCLCDGQWAIWIWIQEQKRTMDCVIYVLECSRNRKGLIFPDCITRTNVKCFEYWMFFLLFLLIVVALCSNADLVGVGRKKLKPYRFATRFQKHLTLITLEINKQTKPWLCNSTCNANTKKTSQLQKKHTCFSLRHSSALPPSRRLLTTDWRCHPSGRSRCRRAEHSWTACPAEAQTDTRGDRQRDLLVSADRRYNIKGLTTKKMNLYIYINRPGEEMDGSNAGCQRDRGERRGTMRLDSGGHT